MNKNLREERKRLEILLERKFLTEEQIEEVEENPLVLQCEYMGYSSDHNGYYWYDVSILAPGFLPEDKNYQSESYNLYVKKEEFED